MNSNIISISRGPQFRDGKSAFLFLFLLVLILFAVIFIIQGDIIASLILSPIIVLSIFLVLDVQGVQINKEEGLVRTYELNIWGKTGKWRDFHQYHSVCLDYETYFIKTRTFYTEYTTTSPNYYANEDNGHFVIYLVNNEEKNNILLGEKSNHKESRELAIYLSEKINLPFYDIFEQRVQESKEKGRR